MKRHMFLMDRPICEFDAPARTTPGAVGEATRTIYADIDCADCLRRMIAEADERARVLRELLARVEASL